MKLYLVSDYSKCGTYFCPYTQFIVIQARSPEMAKQKALKHGDDFGRNKNIHVQELTADRHGILYEHQEADY